MPTHSAKILVAEDHPGCRDSIAAVLTELGYTVKHCKTGVEALAAVATESFDLLVAAADLPDFPGLELGRLLREHRPQLRVLFTTNGVVGPDVLPKPFTLQQLADAVDHALQGAPQRAITAVFDALDRPGEDGS